MQHYCSLAGWCRWDSRDFLLGLSSTFLLNCSLPSGEGLEEVPLSQTHTVANTDAANCTWALAHDCVRACTHIHACWMYKGLAIALMCVYIWSKCEVGKTELLSVLDFGCLPAEQYEISTLLSYTCGSWPASNATTWEAPSVCPWTLWWTIHTSR